MLVVVLVRSLRFSRPYSHPKLLNHGGRGGRHPICGKPRGRPPRHRAMAAATVAPRLWDPAAWLRALHPTTILVVGKPGTTRSAVVRNLLWHAQAGGAADHAVAVGPAVVADPCVWDCIPCSHTFLGCDDAAFVEVLLRQAESLRRHRQADNARRPGDAPVVDTRQHLTIVADADAGAHSPMFARMLKSTINLQLTVILMARGPAPLPRMLRGLVDAVMFMPDVTADAAMRRRAWEEWNAFSLEADFEAAVDAAIGTDATRCLVSNCRTRMFASALAALRLPTAASPSADPFDACCPGPWARRRHALAAAAAA